jgi:hypothetical protein
MEAVDSPESSENVYDTTRCHNQEEDKYCYVYVCDYRRVLDWMIGFIALIHSTRNYKQYRAATADLQFTVHRYTHKGSQSSLVLFWQRISTQ